MTSTPLLASLKKASLAFTFGFACSLSITTDAYAESCDTTLSGNYSLTSFQAALEDSTDADGDGRINVCLGRTTYIRRVAGERSAAIPYDNMTLTGLGSFAYLYSLDSDLRYGGGILSIGDKQGFKISNIYCLLLSPYGSCINVGAGGELAEANNIIASLYGDHSDAINADGTSAEQKDTVIGSVSNSTFYFAARSANSGIDPHGVRGISVRNGVVGKLDKLTFRSSQRFDHAIHLFNAVAESITNITFNGAGGVVTVHGSRVDTISGLRGSAGSDWVGLVTSIGSRARVGLITDADVTLTGYGDLLSAQDDSLIGAVRNARITTTSEFATGITLHGPFAGSNQAVLTSVSDIDFSGVGQALYLPGGRLAMMSNFTITSPTPRIASIYLYSEDAVIELMQNGEIMNDDPSKAIKLSNGATIEESYHVTIGAASE